MEYSDYNASKIYSFNTFLIQLQILAFNHRISYICSTRFLTHKYHPCLSSSDIPFCIGNQTVAIQHCMVKTVVGCKFLQGIYLVRRWTVNLDLRSLQTQLNEITPNSTYNIVRLYNTYNPVAWYIFHFCSEQIQPCIYILACNFGNP